MGGDEFSIRDFVPTESIVFILGRRFSLLDVPQSAPFNRSHHLGNGKSASAPLASDSSVSSLDHHLLELDQGVTRIGRRSNVFEKPNSSDHTLHDELEAFLDSLVFMSYRKDFAPMYRFENDRHQSVVDSLSLQGSSTCLPDVIRVTSDAGWGCTIRCTQMLVFEALKRHFPSPEHIWASTNKSSHYYRRLSRANGQSVRDRSSSSPTICGYQFLERPTPQLDRESADAVCHRTCYPRSVEMKPDFNSSVVNQFRNELLLRWFLDVPSPPEDHPFSIFAFVRSAGGGFGWAHPLYGRMALESKLLLAFTQQQKVNFSNARTQSEGEPQSPVSYRSTLPTIAACRGVGMSRSRSFDSFHGSHLLGSEFSTSLNSSHRNIAVGATPTGRSPSAPAAPTVTSLPLGLPKHEQDVTKQKLEEPLSQQPIPVVSDIPVSESPSLALAIIPLNQQTNYNSKFQASVHSKTPACCPRNAFNPFTDDLIFFGKRPGDW